MGSILKITEIAAGKSDIYKWLSGSKHGTYRVIKTMEFYRKEIYGDHSLYLWNRTSRDFWKAFLDGYCLPLELNAAEQRDILDPAFPAEK